METLIILNNKRTAYSKKLKNNDQYPESLVKYFLTLYTKVGDKVFDPFAGLGTSLIVSEKMKRIPFGIEINKKRYNFIKNRLTYPENIVCGDSRRLNKIPFPKFDFSITSPPYNPNNEKNYLGGKGKYQEFILDIGKIYFQLKQYMKKNSYLVIEAANLKTNNVTTLAWDIGKEISKIFHFEGEVIVYWKNKKTNKNNGSYGYGYDHSYCLVFKNR